MRDIVNDTKRRAYPICGDCIRFVPDEKRTSSYVVGGLSIRYGTCKFTGIVHDRCDIMPKCRAYIRAAQHNYHIGGGSDTNGIPTRCISDGKMYQSVRACAHAYGAPPEKLRQLLYTSNKPNSRCKWHGIEFEYAMDKLKGDK